MRDSILEKKGKSLNLIKHEKQGLYILLILIALEWGGLAIFAGIMFLITWLALGLTLFSLWKVIEGLLERREENG